MYSFEANLHIVDSGLLSNNKESMKRYLISMKPKSAYVICPGLPSSVSFPPPAKQLKVLPDPLQHKMDERCLLWHAPKIGNPSPARKCTTCVHIVRDCMSTYNIRQLKNPVCMILQYIT